MECTLQGQRNTNVEGVSKPPTTPQGASQLLPDVSFNYATQGRKILSYYVGCFVPAISVATTPTSFYTSLYVPMAFQSDSVLNALIPCAALHPSRMASGARQVSYYRDLSDRFASKCHGFFPGAVFRGCSAIERASAINPP